MKVSTGNCCKLNMTFSPSNRESCNQYLLAHHPLQNAQFHLVKEHNMEVQPLISLTSIDVQESVPKTFEDHAGFISLLSEHDVGTSRGKMHVSRQGKEGKPAIVTFHDIGQNHTSAFLGFFNFHETRPLLEHFCIYHIDAPGQEENSAELPAEYLYPTLDELAVMVGEVVDFFNIKRFIGFGVGAGANILCRYALNSPSRVEALVLVELVASTGGWMDWGYQKVRFFCTLLTPSFSSSCINSLELS